METKAAPLLEGHTPGAMMPALLVRIFLPCDVQFAHQGAVDPEPPVLIDEHDRLAAPVADDGAELVEAHDDRDRFHALRRRRSADRLPRADKVPTNSLFEISAFIVRYGTEKFRGRSVQLQQTGPPRSRFFPVDDLLRSQQVEDDPVEMTAVGLDAQCGSDPGAGFRSVPQKGKDPLRKFAHNKIRAQA